MVRTSEKVGRTNEKKGLPYKLYNIRTKDDDFEAFSNSIVIKIKIIETIINIKKKLGIEQEDQIHANGKEHTHTKKQSDIRRKRREQVGSVVAVSAWRTFLNLQPIEKYHTATD